jgi:hypothetical protein
VKTTVHLKASLVSTDGWIVKLSATKELPAVPRAGETVVLGYSLNLHVVNVSTYLFKRPVSVVNLDWSSSDIGEEAALIEAEALRTGFQVRKSPRPALVPR